MAYRPVFSLWLRSPALEGEQTRKLFSQSNIVCCTAHRNWSWYKAFHPVSETEETSMQHRFKERCAPETLNLFALIAVMALFAGGLFYAGEYLSAPRQTAQLVVPNLNP
jgi:hypothetical protein